MTINIETWIKTDLKDGIYTRHLSKDKLFVYWYTAPVKMEVVKRFFKKAVDDQIVRVYDVTNKLLKSEETCPYLDIRVPLQQNYWTIKGLKENKVYIFELGLLIENHYFPLHRSSIVQLDPNAPIEEQTSLQLVITNSRGWNGNVSTYSFYENLEGSE